MFIVIGKIKKLKSKFKCLTFEISEFENIEMFHREIGDEYHFTHCKKTNDEILIFNSFVHRDNKELKHIGLIFENTRFLKRVNNITIVELFNRLLDDIFKVSISDERELTKSKGFDCVYNAEYL